MLSGAMRAFEQFVRTCDIPVAMTLLGIGCFPASDPMNLGMMGMHGEAWVNQAIQEADLLIALGMRFEPHQIVGAAICILGMMLASVLGKFSFTAIWAERALPLER